MDDTKNIIKDQLLKLPENARDFVVKAEWTDTLKMSVSQFNLSDEREYLIEYQVLNVLIGLSPSEELAENIIRKTGIDKNIAEWITESIEKDILEPYSELFPEETVTETIDAEKFAPNSYEQILINQAKAMRPVGVAPSNLPTTESRSLNPEASKDGGAEKKAIHNYIGYTGSDPYREPAE